MKAKQDIIFSGEAYRYFVNSARSMATKNAYTKALRLYMRFKGLTDCEQLLKGEPKLIQSNIIEWLIHLKEVQNLSSASITLYCTALRHFYDMNDITRLNWKKISSFIGENIKTIKDRPYTREEISKLLDAAQDRRLKIAILLMCGSGLRIGSLTGLKLQNLQRLPNYGIYQITVYENTKEEYFTFCTPECASAIDSYLEFRKRNGDRLRPSEPLLREEFDFNDQIRAASPKTLSTFGLRGRIFRLLVSSGVRERKPQLERVRDGEKESDTNQQYDRRDVMQCHGFRKFFSTTCTLQGLPPLTVEVLMGHKALGITGVYFKPTPNDLLEGNDKMLGYANIMKFLTISDEHRLRVEVEKLAAKNRDKEDIISSSLREKEERIEILTRKAEKFEKLLQSLVESGYVKSKERF
ncbi:MAG: tyrosine-type recombinase/integrase [Nitrososphaerales archaeon]